MLYKKFFLHLFGLTLKLQKLILCLEEVENTKSHVVESEFFHHNYEKN